MDPRTPFQEYHWDAVRRIVRDKTADPDTAIVDAQKFLDSHSGVPAKVIEILDNVRRSATQTVADCIALFAEERAHPGEIIPFFESDF